MAGCMLAGVITVLLSNKLPSAIRKSMAFVVLLGGLWNVLWYSLQHLTEFWGIAALISGFLMVLTAMYLMCPGKLPKALIKAKPLVVGLLLICGLYYAITITRL